MANLCSQTVLTGVDGSIAFTPAGTEFCLKDFTDFPAGDEITVPTEHEFQDGDPVVFTEEHGGNLDSALTAGTTYYVVATTNNSIEVSATEGGTAITLNGDGGTGSADSAGHVKIDYAEYAAVCQVKSFELNLSRETIDTTALPCGSGAGGGRLAPFRTSQSGYASGDGSMQVQFTEGQTSLANRLLANSMLRSQNGAAVRLYVMTRYDATGVVDTNNSLYIEAPISIQGFSLSVSPEDATVADLSFTLSGQPTHLFDF